MKPPAQFLPEKLFDSAKEEVLFGSGEYLMALDSHKQIATTIKHWNMALINLPLGLGFEAKPSLRNRTMLKIILSPLGKEAIVKAGFDEEELEVIGMLPEPKRDFLRLFEAALVKLTGE